VAVGLPALAVVVGNSPDLDRLIPPPANKRPGDFPLHMSDSAPPTEPVAV